MLHEFGSMQPHVAEGCAQHCERRRPRSARNRVPMFPRASIHNTDSVLSPRPPPYNEVAAHGGGGAAVGQPGRGRSICGCLCSHGLRASTVNARGCVSAGLLILIILIGNVARNRLTRKNQHFKKGARSSKLEFSKLSAVSFCVRFFVGAAPPRKCDEIMRRCIFSPAPSVSTRHTRNGSNCIGTHAKSTHELQRQ